MKVKDFAAVYPQLDPEADVLLFLYDSFGEFTENQKIGYMGIINDPIKGNVVLLASDEYKQATLNRDDIPKSLI